MHKPVCRENALLIAMAAAWAALTPTTQAAVITEITTSQGTTTFAGLFTSMTITPTGSFMNSQGIALSFQYATLGTFNNNGTIQSGGGGGAFNNAAMDIDTASGVDTFNNAGLIAGTPGVVNNATGLSNRGIIGTLVNDASGIIEGFVAVNNSGTITSLINQGTIQGMDTGILNQGTIISLTNYGLIESDYAILSSNTLINGITNNGTIRGIDAAIYYSGFMPVINNNGTLSGNISNNTTNVLTINGGNSYDSLMTGYSGGGTVYSSAADVHFGTGKLTVDDDFLMGSHTVVNDGASLLLNRTVTITGNYIQQAQGELTIGVANPAIANGTTLDSGYGRLVVSGNATFAPGSSVSLLSTNHRYGFASGQRFLVVQASGTGTQYNAGNLTYSVAGYSGMVSGQAVTINGTNGLVVYLDSQAPLTPGITTTPHDLATTPNAIASLRGLGGYSGFSDGLLNLFNASKAMNSSEEANKAGEQLSAVQNSAAASRAAAASYGALAAVNNHINSARLVRHRSLQRGISTDDDALGWAVWGQPFYSSSRQGMSDNVSGYSAHYSGVVLGVDRLIADRWRVGGAFSYAHTSVNGRDNLTGSYTDVDAWSGIAYASWSGNPLYVNLASSVSTQKYDSHRQIHFDGFAGDADGSFNGQQVMITAEAGYPIFFAQRTTLTPLVAVAYSYIHQDDYKEHSDQGAALNVEASHTQSVLSSLGAKLEHTWSTDIGDAVPFVQALWTHEYDRSRTAINASYVADVAGQTRFTSFGAIPVADMAEIGAGMELVQDNDLNVSARYDLSVAPNFNAQTVSLRLRKTF